LTYTSSPSLLQISGTPSLPYVQPGDGLQIQVQSSGQLRVAQVSGGALFSPIFFPQPTTLLLNLSYTNRDITIDLNGHRLGSSIYINLGLGDFTPPSATFPPGRTLVNIISGTVGGNLTIVNGGGAEFVNLGGGTFVSGAPVTIQGNTSLTLKANQTSAGQTLFAFGNVLDVNPGSSLNGSLSTSGVENVNLGQAGLPAAFARKGLAMTNAGSAYVGILDIFGEVDGNVQFTASPAIQSPIVDTVFEDTTGLVTGLLTASLGQGGGNFTLLGTVQGNVSVSSVVGNDIVNLQGAIFQSALVQLGNGNNLVTFNGTATIGGNLTISAGNGDNTLALAGTLNGTLSVNLGSGTNVAVIFTGPGNQLTWVSGNGSDDLTLGPASYNVNITFGDFVNTLTLDPGTTLSGIIRGSGGTNNFNQNGATLLPTLQFINFP
jgi:hypothetical protein